MLLCSLPTETKYSKNKPKQIYSYEDKKITVLSPQLSVSYRCLINYLKYNKLELNLNNINKYINLFLEQYNYTIKYSISTNIREQFKQEISSVNYDKYFDSFMSVGNALLPFGMAFFSLIRSKTANSDNEFKLTWKHKVLIILVLLGIVVYYIVKIEAQCPLLEEIKHMAQLKNYMKNIKNIQDICIESQVYNNRSALLSKMFNNLNNNDKYKVEMTNIGDFDLSCDLSLIISNINNKDISNNILDLDVSNNILDLDISNNILDLDVSNNILDLDISNNILDLDVSNNNLDVSNNNLELINLNLDVSNNNLNTSNNICNIINKQEVISQENIEDNQENNKEEIIETTIRQIKPTRTRQTKQPQVKTKQNQTKNQSKTKTQSKTRTYTKKKINQELNQ